MKIDLLETPSEDVRIEIIPLIDVIFCILTFFILAAVGLTRQQAIDVDLPQATTGSPLPPQGLGADARQRERLYVGIDAIGQIYIEQYPVSPDELSVMLERHKRESPQGQIVLYASPDARYDDVIQVLDLLRLFGGDRVALATLPGELPDTEDLLQDDSFLNLPSFPSTIDEPILETPGTSGSFEPFPPDSSDD